MFVEGRTIELSNNAGFELPSNIGELGDSVTKIDLSGHGLRGELDSAECFHDRSQIHRFTRAGLLPKTMPPSLEVIILNDNDFKGGIPAEWSSLSNLKTLNMDRAGKFTGGIPAEWASLKKLTQLDLDNTGVQGMCLRSAQHLERKP